MHARAASHCMHGGTRHKNVLLPMYAERMKVVVGICSLRLHMAAASTTGATIATLSSTITHQEMSTDFGLLQCWFCCCLSCL